MKSAALTIDARNEVAHSPTSARRCVVLATLCFCFLAFAKTPTVFSEPRFWGEEGSVFFRALQDVSFLDAATYTYRGSILLPTSLSVWLAAQLPLAFAPTVTTYLGFVVQVSVAALLGLWAHDRGVGRLALLLLVGAWAFLPPTYETWASATNMQWNFAVALLLVLLLRGERLERRRWLWRGLALIAGLSGVVSCMLAPSFVQAGLRSRQHLWIGLILGACATLQIAVLMAAGSAGRPMVISPGLVIAAWGIKCVLLPFAGANLGAMALHALPSTALLLAFPLIGAAGVQAAYVALTPSGKAQFWLLAPASVIVTALSVFGTLGDPLGSLALLGNLRYFLFGSVALCLLLSLVMQNQRWAWVPASLLAAVSLVGIADRGFAPAYRQFVEGPSWSAQLETCQRRPCEVRIWPDVPGWILWSTTVRH